MTLGDKARFEKNKAEVRLEQTYKQIKETVNRPGAYYKKHRVLPLYSLRLLIEKADRISSELAAYKQMLG